jgi:Uma2 family endonuclease
MSAMPVTTERLYTVEEYLELDRASEIPHEYLQGRIVAMADPSRPHNLLVTSIGASLHGQLRGRPCEVYLSRMRLQIPSADVFTYPDVTVVCEEPELADEYQDTLLNPKVLIEVLSPSTSDYDHGRKFAYYRQLASLVEYLLVAQEEVRVEHYTRQSDGSWRLEETDDPAAVIVLPAIGCVLSLVEVYEKVPMGSA